MADALFAVRNALCLGAYQRAIAEAAEVGPLDASTQAERDVLVYRAYVGQGLYKVSGASAMECATLRLESAVDEVLDGLEAVV